MRRSGVETYMSRFGCYYYYCKDHFLLIPKSLYDRLLSVFNFTAMIYLKALAYFPRHDVCIWGRGFILYCHLTTTQHTTKHRRRSSAQIQTGRWHAIQETNRGTGTTAPPKEPSDAGAPPKKQTTRHGHRSATQGAVRRKRQTKARAPERHQRSRRTPERRPRNKPRHGHQSATQGAVGRRSDTQETNRGTKSDTPDVDASRSHTNAKLYWCLQDNDTYKKKFIHVHISFPKEVMCTCHPQNSNSHKSMLLRCCAQWHPHPTKGKGWSPCWSRRRPLRILPSWSLRPQDKSEASRPTSSKQARKCSL